MKVLNAHNERAEKSDSSQNPRDSVYLMGLCSFELVKTNIAYSCSRIAGGRLPPASLNSKNIHVLINIYSKYRDGRHLTLR